MRTTSSLESMNAVLRRTFPNHPHIFKFLDRLRFHEYSKFLDMIDAVRSADVPTEPLKCRKKLKDINRENKIKHLTKELKTDADMTTENFLQGMAACNDEFLPQIGKILNSHVFNCDFRAQIISSADTL